MQDILQLDGTNRMNTPGTTVGNWQWRFSWKQVTREKYEQVAQWIRDANRVV